MKINTLSIVVPTSGCVNKCKFCVSKTHENNYCNLSKEKFTERYNFYIKGIESRLKYAVLHKVDTIILTGTGEPLQNREFLILINDIITKLGNPFPRIELQTSGVLLNDENLKLLKQINVNTISLSISNLFDNNKNMETIGVIDKLKFNLEELCNRIYSYDFNIRLSLNMVNDYIDISPERFFIKAKELNAAFITFRKLYFSDNGTKEDIWVKENKLSDDVLNDIMSYIKEKGSPLYKLPFGYVAYAVDEISTLFDDNCMDSIETDADDVLKYLILREDGKLYCKWDDKGSLIF